MERRIALKKLGLIPLAIVPFGSCRTHARLPAGEEWNQRLAPSSQSSGNSAPLLEAAKRRIEQIRKGRLSLSFTQAGQKLTGASFQIQHLRHDFRFGTTLLPSFNGNPGDEAERLFKSFNSFTAKCYWNERWHHPIEKAEGKRDYSGFEDEVRFGQQMGMQVKGHPLLWTVPKALPDWLLRFPPEIRLERMLAHAGDMVNRYKGQVTTWDVCNEFLWEPSLRHTEERVWPHLEPISEILTYLEPGIRHIRKLDPSAKLVLNEYGLEKDFTKGVTARQQRQRYLELLEEMRKRGCLPDAVGTQCHVSEPFSMEEIQTTLDELSTAGLPLQITEFWARKANLKKDENTQADEDTINYIRNAYTLGFGHPAVEHFTYWGSDLVTKDGKLGPKGKVILQLLREEWTTKVDLQTDNSGGFSCQAFFGEYALMKEGKELQRFRFSKEHSGKPLELVL